jgi:hypothetical protein
MKNKLKEDLRMSPFIYSIINHANIMDLVLDLMTNVQRLKRYSGMDKKDMVLDMAEYVIENNIHLTAGETIELKRTLNTSLGSMIDFVIHLARNKKLLKKFSKSCKCFPKDI